MKTILDLCSGSGNWSAPYLEAGYDVRRIDLPEDVRLVEYPCPVHGILCAPPCTVFSLAGVWVQRTPDEIKLALSVVDACLRLVVAWRPHTRVKDFGPLSMKAVRQKMVDKDWCRTLVNQRVNREDSYGMVEPHLAFSC